MSQIENIKTLLDNAEYEYNKRCKKTGYRYPKFRTMMIGYVCVSIIILAGVIIWVW